MKPVGIYIHIPFCIKKCNYCDFYSIKAEESQMDIYIEHLINSIHDWADKIKGRCVDSIYFGGGTPSVLGTERINKILNAVFSLFDVTYDCETTIEVNPNSSDKLDFYSLKTNGINRVSIGLQSSDDEELNVLGRSHKSKDASYTIERVLSSGINNFSLDVMLGIPLQTFETLNKTLDFCVDSSASHISTYMLKIEKNTPFFFNKENLVFADDDTQADLYEYTCKKLSASGFRHYEISNFCKDDLVSKHNMKYWLLDDYIGIGPSAHSLICDKRYYYPKHMEGFFEGNLVFDSEGHTIEEYIMLSLRTDTGLLFEKYKELFNLIPSQELIEEGKKLEKLGLVVVDEYSIKLTEKGYLVSNAVISRFLNTRI